MNIIETLKTEIGDDGMKLLEKNAMLASVQMAMIRFRDDVVQKKKSKGLVVVQDVEESVSGFISSQGYVASAGDGVVMAKKVSSVLYKEYRDFCASTGRLAYSSVRFFMVLSELSFQKRRTSGGIVYEVYVAGVAEVVSTVESSINAFMDHSNYANNAQKLFGDDVLIEEGYMANRDGKLIGVREEMAASLLYQEYKDFCTNTGVDAYSGIKFSAGISGLGFTKKRFEGGVFYDVWANVDKS